MNDKEMIQFWKSNEKPFGLCPKECQEWFRGNFSGKVVEYYSEGWEKTNTPSFHSEYAYRIPADYDPAKVGRWVECQVFQAGDYYQYQFRHPRSGTMSLIHAPGMVGFGGVLYENEPIWKSCLGWTGNEKPQKPLKVRFWVED